MSLYRIGLFVLGLSGFVLALAYFIQKAVAQREADEESIKRVAGNFFKGMASAIAAWGVIALAITTNSGNILKQLQTSLIVVALAGAMMGIFYLIQLLFQRKRLAQNEKTYLGITGHACILAAIGVLLIALSVTQL